MRMLNELMSMKKNTSQPTPSLLTSLSHTGSSVGGDAGGLSSWGSKSPLSGRAPVLSRAQLFRISGCARCTQLPP